MIRIRTKIVETRPLDITRANWRKITRESHLKMGEYWQQNYLPLHFTPTAYFLYKHKQRTRKYREKKLRLAERGIVELGGKVDNVFAGDMMQMMMTNLKLRGFPTRVQIKMMGPKYISMRPNRFAGSNQPNKAAEITTVRETEAQQLSKILELEITTRLEKARAPRTTEIG